MQEAARPPVDTADQGGSLELGQALGILRGRVALVDQSRLDGGHVF